MTKLDCTCQYLHYLIQLIKNVVLKKIHKQERAKYIEIMICIQPVSVFSPNEVPGCINLTNATPEDYSCTFMLPMDTVRDYAPYYVLPSKESNIHSHGYFLN